MGRIVHYQHCSAQIPRCVPHRQARKVTPWRLTKQKGEVTCKRCLRVMYGWAPLAEHAKCPECGATEIPSASKFIDQGLPGQIRAQIEAEESRRQKFAIYNCSIPYDCPRCGGGHAPMIFWKWRDPARAVDASAYHTTCPTTSEPIIIYESPRRVA